MSDIPSNSRNQSPHTMMMDVAGRVRNTRVGRQHGFQPLFEAVVNSIHSTEDRFDSEVAKKGHIQIKVERVPQVQLPGVVGKRPELGISTITILDNGAGFTDANQTSFETADSLAKMAKGGKGVGRFTWLVVFQRAEIESVYLDPYGKVRRRAFVFKPTTKGIEDYVEETSQEELRTSVVLRNPQSRYAESLRRSGESIADALFQHCFNYFVLGRCPKVELLDVGPEETLRVFVNDRRKELTVERPLSFDVGEHELRVQYVRQGFKVGRRHLAHLCAHDLVVTSFSLNEISDLGTEPMKEPGKAPEVCHAYVSGESLDAAVDTTRRRLDLPFGQPILEEAGELDLRSLRSALGNHVNNHLKDILEAERRENFKQIERHIRTAQPEYRHLLTRRRQQLERVRWSSDARALDERLYGVQQEYEAEIRTRQAKVEERLSEEGAELDRIAEELYNVVMETNEFGQANLVKYVVKRRAVLNLLSRLISRFDGHTLEEQIHKIVFPIRKTADEVALDDHNLWLVDDTLAFYEFLSSDIPFSRNEAAPSDSLRRPDLLAFKTGEPYQYVTIVEFKRPDRADDNPVQQLVEYAQLLRKGGSVDAQGVTLPGIPNSVRIDGYAIVTLTPEMESKLEISPGNLRKVETEWRWYGSSSTLNMTIEVLDFRAFLLRAEQRNRSLFAKLGLS